MQQHRYRISFIAHFERTIIADSAEQAKRYADTLQMQWPEIALAEDTRPTCAWNTIEPLREPQDSALRPFDGAQDQDDALGGLSDD